MSAYKLFTDAGNFRAFKILIAAEYNGVEVEVPEFKVGTDNKTTEFLAKSPLGRVPVLETSTGSIFESNAIARFVARIRQDTGLTGSTLVESAQVDSLIDFNSHEIELPATLWFYPVLGSLPFNSAATEKAKADLAKALKVLDNHLADKTYLVGHKITLADITIASTLVYPFKFVADARYRSAFPNVIRWFTTLVNQPAFEAVVGTVVFAEKELTVAGAAAIPFDARASTGAAPKEKQAKVPKAAKAPKEEKPKAEKKPVVKDDDDEPEPDFVEEKKQDHPFKLLDQTNKSPFVMDTWKKTYSNADDYHAAMEVFFNSFDAQGWSLFRGDYKYDEESKVLFMTSNLIAGFIQRTEEIRKWLFGTLTIRGVEGAGTMKVTAYFLIRGDSIEPLIKCNDDAECYKWTKLETPITEADKKQLYDYWCSEGPLDGEPCLDSRCYK
eukprot:gene26549-33147_t